MANATESPNPSTPLAFLPSALASQLEVSRYVYAATLGAYVWDIGLNLGNDYALLIKHRVRFPTIIYFLSRAFTLAYILGCFVLQVAPVKNCNSMSLALAICFVLSQSATAMLFFLRVTAVWYPSKIAYVVFSILWIALLAAGIPTTIEVRGEHIGPTEQCIAMAVPVNTEVVIIIPMINNTAIFLAINYRILAHTIVADSSVARLRVLFGGKGLFRISEALLRSGQHFYLIAVVTHIASLVAVKLPHLPAAYHIMLSVLDIALINAMACLVFRRIKFGLISSDGTSYIPTLDFHATANPRSVSFHYGRTAPTTAELGTNTTFPFNVPAHNEIDGVEKCADASQEMFKPTDLA
ncbi:hypothetical protein MSAN_02308400 [Mycena sanguinolenta]|uniref:Uncharacterized protein n=1 Tax=Mycena sanguinolenta TaxID=230812 RepID=A0A8H7CFZ8_9AGAR|nr:hypothetical protein MSAN_02308400 [Mycena sanguinolenta]